ncbi:hypothetical protein [Burkholderia phage BCSR52]|uniref:Uncharacterized protein n=1 Tax=Burkholderia phage BCSR52 TaxID=2805748 RepID=A0A889IQL5_9CAUD|nr:hypothetical protein [Burkholderia phage BCSR52]
MNNPSAAAIKAALELAISDDDHNAIIFLDLWFHGDFDAIRREFPEVTDEDVFIGADPFHPGTIKEQEQAAKEKKSLQADGQLLRKLAGMCWSKTETRVPRQVKLTIRATTQTSESWKNEIIEELRAFVRVTKLNKVKQK